MNAPTASLAVLVAVVHSAVWAAGPGASSIELSTHAHGRVTPLPLSRDTGRQLVGELHAHTENERLVLRVQLPDVDSSRVTVEQQWVAVLAVTADDQQIVLPRWKQSSSKPVQLETTERKAVLEFPLAWLKDRSFINAFPAYSKNEAIRAVQQELSDDEPFQRKFWVDAAAKHELVPVVSSIRLVIKVDGKAIETISLTVPSDDCC